MQTQVEEMYKDNKDKVTLVAHSMGGPVMLYFLNSVVSQEWKNVYINAFIPISGAWAGGNRGLITFVSQISVENNTYLKLFTSSYPTMSSTAWLLPNPKIWKKETLIVTLQRNYTSEDFDAMFTDMNSKEDYIRFEKSLSINKNYPSLTCQFTVSME